MPPRLHRLDRRDVPAVAAVGPEIRVSLPGEAEVARPALGLDADGDFLVAWQSYTDADANFDVLARRYAADGTALGNPFPVNTSTFGSQQNPAVAMTPTAGAVVVWGSTSAQDGSREGVYLRRFAADGSPLTGEIRVNVHTSHIQGRPSVAVDGDGDFTVAWHSYNQDGSLYGIYARRFSPAGTPLGGEIAVNQTTAGSQRDPVIGSDAAGNFVVAWYGPDGDGSGIFARRFTSSGTPLGDEFRVNAATTGDQTRPAVAVAASGATAIFWHSPAGLAARRFTAAGAGIGDEFVVNATALPDERPAVTADATGTVVGVWSGPGAEDPGVGIVGRAYSPANGPIGGEFRANDTTAGAQTQPAVSASPAGDFVVAWHGGQPDAVGIYAQRFAIPPVPRAAVVLDDGTAQRSTIRTIDLAFTTKVALPAGAITVTGPAGPIELVVGDAGSSLSLTKVRVTFAGPGVEFGSLGDGRYTLTLHADSVVNANGDPLDGNGDGTGGDNFVLAFHRLFGDFDGDARVNFADFLRFRSAFGQSAGDSGFWAAADFDDDGAADFVDFLAFRTRFGVVLP